MSKDYIVYVMVNNSGYIIAVNSSAFLTDTAGWTEIDRGNSDKYHHAQNNYFPNSIFTEGGAYRYKLVNNKAVKKCTLEEIVAQEEKNRPEEKASQLDIIEAQVTYTAMMTNTMLEV